MIRQLKYEEVIKYLSTYPDGSEYDFNGLLHLVLEGVDNLRRHSIDGDFLSYAGAITDPQADFLQKLLSYRERSIAEFEQDM